MFNIMLFSNKIYSHLFVTNICSLFAGDITQKGFEKKKARLLAPFQRGNFRVIYLFMFSLIVLLLRLIDGLRFV